MPRRVKSEKQKDGNLLYGIVAIFLIIIVLGFLFSSHLLSFSSCPPLPPAIYSGANATGSEGTGYSSTGISIVSCVAQYQNSSLTPAYINYSFVYYVNHNPSTGAPYPGVAQSASIRVVSTRTASLISASNQYNQMQLQTVMLALNQTQAQLKQNSADNSCGFNSNTCSVELLGIQASTETAAIINSAIAFNNQQSTTSVSTVTTIASTTSTIVGQSTTQSTTTTIQQSSSGSQNILQQFFTWLQNLFSKNWISW
ncbi:MAG: hypothetical protein KGI06_03820 [Candidatus Micrarchaeota archaeon]|nr:hypothetical protein [Candidatus Micrarchaeota archaeon]